MDYVCIAQEMYYKFDKWSAGDPVIHNDRSARVIAVPLKAATGFKLYTVSVPIMYDDSEAGFFLVVDGSELAKRYL